MGISRNSLTVGFAEALTLFRKKGTEGNRENRGFGLRFLCCLLFSLSLIASGCQKQCFLSESDFQHALAMGIPANLESDPGLAIVPSPGSVPAPTTVDDTKRPARYLSLREAIAIALENGNVGIQNPATPGLATDAIAGFQGTAVAGADAIRVLALDPAIVATNRAASNSRASVRDAIAIAVRARRSSWPVAVVPVVVAAAMHRRRAPAPLAGVLPEP